MSIKTYRTWTVIIAIIVALLVAWSVITKNALTPAPTVIVGSTILLVLRRRVKEVTTDERTFRITDKAARFTLNIFIILAAMVGATMLALGGDGSTLIETAGFTLAYSICTLLVLYNIGYIYYNRKYGGKE